MVATTVAGADSCSSKLIAPAWHLALLVALFLALTVGGAFFQRAAGAQPEAPQQHPNVVPLYLSLLVMEWGLVYYVWQGGLRHTGTTLRELIGGKWTSPRDLLIDTALALGMWSAWTIVDIGWDRWFGPGHAASINTMLPRGAVEISAWVMLSVSAGFCEELVFRGYIHRQFEALVRSRGIALCLQAALFGISHGYQGTQACAKIAIYGALMGLLALWRRSLRPGMIAHAWTDIAAGVFGI